MATALFLASNKSPFWIFKCFCSIAAPRKAVFVFFQESFPRLFRLWGGGRELFPFRRPPLRRPPFRAGKSSLPPLLGWRALQTRLPRNTLYYRVSLSENNVEILLTFLSLKWNLQHCMNDLEIFAILLSAIIHDVEHTGTTNNFHVNSR